MERLLKDLTNLCTLETKQAEIASRLQELNQLKEKYSDLCNEILDLIPEDLVEPECHQFSDYFRQIQEADRSSVKNSGSGESQSSGRNHSGMKLPKLDLPSFYGDVFNIFFVLGPVPLCSP